LAGEALVRACAADFEMGICGNDARFTTRDVEFYARDLGYMSFEKRDVGEGRSEIVKRRTPAIQLSREANVEAFKYRSETSRMKELHRGRIPSVAGLSNTSE
jgi:hypothetical protein